MIINIEELNIIIAQEIRIRREALGFSQRKLAKKVNLSHTKIAMIEGSKGFKKHHSLFCLMLVCEGLKIKISDLIKKVEK